MLRARRGRWATLLLAAVGGTVGLGPVLLATAQPAWAFVARVYIDGQAFSPQKTDIKVGDKVIWRNRTDQTHSVTFDSIDSDDTLGTKGAEAERRFDTAGTYTYHCTFHNGMTGTVVVEEKDAPTTTSTAPPPPTTAPPPTTTTTTEPPPTTTTAEPTTTTTAAPRPPAEVPSPPVPNTAAATPPTRAPSSTTTAPPTTTTTAAPATTTSAPPAPAGEQVTAPSTSPAAPPTTEATRRTDEAAAGRSGRSDGGLDVTAIALVTLLVAVGLFGAWTLIRVRPGRI